MTFTHNKHYIGNIIAKHFYYKDEIFAYYHLHFLTFLLPDEIIDRILTYICSSLVVFATNFTIHYINPRDNAVIKSIQLKKMRGLNSYNNTFAISEDGLTFYRIYRRHIELEYLCDEVPDPNKPPHKKTDGNRYYYSYNIAKKCKFSNVVLPYAPMYGIYGGRICISSNGKYIANSIDKDHVINKSSSYITIYDAKTKTFFKELKVNAKAILSISFSPDNKKLLAVVAQNDKHEIWLWNTEDTNNAQVMYLDNVYFEILSDKIIWNQDSSKYAITFQLLNNINVGQFEALDYNRYNMVNGACIFFGSYDGNFRFNINNNHINHITWINNDKIAYYNNRIIVNYWNKLVEEGTVIENSSIDGLSSSIDGHIIIQKYFKDVYADNDSDSDGPNFNNYGSVTDYDEAFFKWYDEQENKKKIDNYTQVSDSYLVSITTI